MVIPTNDENTRATWVSQLRALKVIEEWVQRATYLDEEEWTEALTESEVGALCTYVQATEGYGDVLALDLDNPTADDHFREADALLQVRGALDQLRSELEDIGPSDTTGEILRSLTLALMENESSFAQSAARRVVYGW